MTKNIVIGVLAVIALLSGCYIFVQSTQAPLGIATGPQHYQLEQFLQGLQIGGRLSSEVKNFSFGSCDLNFGTAPTSFAASTTKTVDCQATNMLASGSAVQAALTGVAAWSATNPDKVFVQAASSTPSTYMGIDINGCSASTTVGYITCSVANMTGAAFTPATTTTHWLQYQSIR